MIIFVDMDHNALQYELAERANANIFMLALHIQNVKCELYFSLFMLWNSLWFLAPVGYSNYKKKQFICT